MNAEAIVNTVERVFRYLVPGFILVVFVRLAFPSTSATLLNTTSGVEFAVAVLCLGLMTYGVHRLLFWVSFDHILSRKGVSPTSKKGQGYGETIGRFVRRRAQCAGTPCLQYLHYRWAVVHYCLMLGEMTCAFSFLNEPGSVLRPHRWGLCLAGAILWCLAMVHYVHMLIGESKACEECKKDSQPSGGG